MNRLLGEIMAAEDEHEKSALIAQLEAIEPRVRCRAHDRFKYQCPDCT